MQPNGQNSLARQMDKQALRLYAALAAVIYILALIYCFSTHHLFEAGLVVLVMLSLGALIAWIYKS